MVVVPEFAGSDGEEPEPCPRSFRMAGVVAETGVGVTVVPRTPPAPEFDGSPRVGPHERTVFGLRGVTGAVCP